MLFQMATCHPIPLACNAIPQVQDDIIPLLGLGYSPKADAGLGTILILDLSILILYFLFPLI
jgi:hypothetical protein